MGDFVFGEKVQDDELHLIRDNSVVVVGFHLSSFYTYVIMDSLLCNYKQRNITMIFVTTDLLQFPEFMKKKMDEWHIASSLVLYNTLPEFQEFADLHRKEIEKASFVTRSVEFKLLS